jgi:hypothetical protein
MGMARTLIWLMAEAEGQLAQLAQLEVHFNDFP